MLKKPAMVYFNDYETIFKTQMYQLINQMPNPAELVLTVDYLSLFNRQMVNNFAPVLLVLDTNDTELWTRPTFQIVPNAMYDVLSYDENLIASEQSTRHAKDRLINHDGPYDYQFHFIRNVVGRAILDDPYQYFMPATGMVALPNVMPVGGNERLFGDYPHLTNLRELQNRAIPLFNFKMMDEATYQKIIQHKAYLFNFMVETEMKRMLQWQLTSPMEAQTKSEIHLKFQDIMNNALHVSWDYTHQKTWPEWIHTFDTLQP